MTIDEYLKDIADRNQDMLVFVPFPTMPSHDNYGERCCRPYPAAKLCWKRGRFRHICFLGNFLIVWLILGVLRREIYRVLEWEDFGEGSLSSVSMINKIYLAVSELTLQSFSGVLRSFE